VESSNVTRDAQKSAMLVITYHLHIIHVVDILKLYIVGFETSPADETADYEHHITGDISQAFYLYLAMTNDTDFMTDGRGAEVITSIADFWASRVTLDDSTGLYHIYGIIDTMYYMEMITGRFIISCDFKICNTCISFLYRVGVISCL
jgi:hypothetical protein